MIVQVLVTIQNGNVLAIPAEIVDQDLVVGSRGANPRDRLKVRIASYIYRVGRRDVCGLDGEPIDWITEG